MKHLIGDATRPIIKTDTTPGPVLVLGFGSTVTLERLQISNAFGDAQPNYGDGIVCGDLDSSARTLTLIDVVVRGNQRNGIRANGCNVTASRSTFIRNIRWGLSLQDSNGNLDGNTVVENGGASAGATGGMSLDGGIYRVTNNFVGKNTGRGIEFYAAPSPARIDFNTVVDNSAGGLSGSTAGGSPSSAKNNIIARNQSANVTCTTCTLSGTLIVGADISSLRFVSPDVAPFDYHVMDGSTALGVADPSSTLMFDADGETRPATGADVGADER